MKELIRTNAGRLRIIALLEGISLLVLIFIAVPLKYMFSYPAGSQVIGPIHGVLFLVFFVLTITVAAEQNWKFLQTTWKVLLASFIPFGTFYVDKKILSKIN